MLSRGRSGEPSPDLLEPLLVVLCRKHAKDASSDGRIAVPSSLALHQNELDVVLDDCVGFVGLAQETGLDCKMEQRC